MPGRAHGIPDDIYAAMKRIAKANDRTMAAEVRRALQRYINLKENQAAVEQMAAVERAMKSRDESAE